MNCDTQSQRVLWATVNSCTCYSQGIRYSVLVTPAAGSQPPRQVRFGLLCVAEGKAWNPVTRRACPIAGPKRNRRPTKSLVQSLNKLIFGDLLGAASKSGVAPLFARPLIQHDSPNTCLTRNLQTRIGLSGSHHAGSNRSVGCVAERSDSYDGSVLDFHLSTQTHLAVRVITCPSA